MARVGVIALNLRGFKPSRGPAALQHIQHGVAGGGWMHRASCALVRQGQLQGATIVAG